MMVNKQQVHTGRQVARVLHGMGSPQLPVSEWETNPFWRRHREVDFNRLLQMANEEIALFAAAARLRNSNSSRNQEESDA